MAAIRTLRVPDAKNATLILAPLRQALYGGVLMNIEVTLVSSFTPDGKGGNPAGVVLNADQLSDAQKLKIAQAVGYSETAFVSSDDEADYEISFFTTTGEVDFCGHATLATFSTMYQKGILTAGSYVQRTKAGMLSVRVVR